MIISIKEIDVCYDHYDMNEHGFTNWYFRVDCQVPMQILRSLRMNPVFIEHVKSSLTQAIEAMPIEDVQQLILHHHRHERDTRPSKVEARLIHEGTNGTGHFLRMYICGNTTGSTKQDIIAMYNRLQPKQINVF